MNAKLANESWEALLRAQIGLLREFSKDTIWSELSLTEYDVLYTLSKCGKAMRLGELNKYLALSQPAVTRMADRLVAKNLIRREQDPSDARSVLLSLTESGAGLQRKIGTRHAAQVTERMQILSEEEQQELKTLCEKLLGR